MSDPPEVIRIFSFVNFANGLSYLTTYLFECAISAVLERATSNARIWHECCAFYISNNGAKFPVLN